LIDEYNRPLQEPPYPRILIHPPIYHARSSIDDIGHHQSTQSPGREKTEAADLDRIQLQIPGEPFGGLTLPLFRAVPLSYVEVILMGFYWNGSGNLEFMGLPMLR
jgi:hypothetical protein